MKVLFISESYYPSISGVPVVVKYLAEGLVQKGHEVTVATSHIEGINSYDIHNGVEIYRFEIHRNFFHCNRGNITEYVDFVLANDADVFVFECTQSITTDLLLPYLKEIKAKKILHSHGFSGLEGSFFSIKPDIVHTLGTTYNWIWYKWYYLYVIPRVLPLFDKFLSLAETDNTNEYLEAHGYEATILDNAADEMFFADSVNINGALKKYARLENDRYVMSCANYQYIKDQITIINEYYKSECSKSTSLVCIGSQKNAYYSKCVEAVQVNERKYGHRDVHLLVGVERSDIPEIERDAALYLVASRCERYSISIIEAMSQGVPFVSTNVGNARVLPGGVTLFDGDSMADKIDYLLTNQDEYNKYSSAGKDFAYCNCRIGAVVEKLERILFDVVGC